MKITNLSITMIVAVIAGIGIALALIFASYNVYSSVSTTQQASGSADLVELAVSASDLVHEQQKERGASAVFLTNKGQSFGPEMRRQREATDAKRLAFAEALAKLREGAGDSRLEGALQSLEAGIAEIDPMRKRIDALAVSRQDEVAFYTALNKQAIGLVGLIAGGVKSPDVAQKLMVYSALLHGKDTAGIDRAIGASGFATGQFDAGLSTKLIALSAKQESYFSYVQELASPAVAQELTDILGSAQSQRINAMRAVALSGDADRISAITASDWFDTQTAKIGTLKALEDKMAAEVRDAMLALSEQAQFETVLALATLVIGIALAAGLSWLFMRVIAQRIDSVVKPLDALARGESDVAIPDFGQNEFRVLSQTMQVMSQAIRDKHKSDEARENVVRALRERLAAMAKGDLNQPINEFFSEDLKAIRMDFNEAQSSLRNVIEGVVATSTSIQHSASDVNQAAGNLSERTSQQAATLEETAAALQRMTRDVEKSAAAAQETNLEVAQTRETAAKNDRIVDSTVTAMERIQKSFAEVEQITKLIQDISFQTNILALNAGVEATRAGEAGKGFSVVASEVRALAQRCSDAATSIQTLMTQSSEHIALGSDQVTASGEALKEMIAQIDSVSQRIADLAEASQDQATGLIEVNSAVSELDKATQSNAAMAEQSSAASALLSGESERLNQMVAVFAKHNRAAQEQGEGQPVDLRMSA